MYKIVSYILLFSFTLSSCDYIGEFFEKDTKRIDFTSVDEYPLFRTCDSLANSETKQQCFENTVTNLLQNALKSQDFYATQPIADAIIVHIEVDNKGQAKLIELETSEFVKESLPQLELLISESIADFPTLIPAKKRNINVNSRYMIPVYIVN